MDRLGAKKKVLADILEYASGGMAKGLKEKYRPLPKPLDEVAEGQDAAVDAAHLPTTPDEDPLAGLDQESLRRLLGD
jgi:hypothetical protein